LFFGFVRPYKGLRLALHAVSLLRRSGVDAFLLVAGEFWEDRHHYEQLACELEIREHLIIDDRYIPNEEVDKYFAAADVLVAPYTGGTQSGVQRLAAGHGLPAVISSSLLDSESGGGVQGGGMSLGPQETAFIEKVIQAFASCGLRVAAILPPSTSWGQLAEAVVASSTGSAEGLSP
jgi:glycosyltransferase involved in cell wall biosynthesis